jgi:hypothetical protein
MNPLERARGTNTCMRQQAEHKKEDEEADAPQHYLTPTIRRVVPDPEV